MTKLAVACSLLAATSALAQSTVFNQRIDQARRAASEERKKLGLDEDAARRSYPTPEVVFTDDKIPVICAGKTGTVTLKGKFPPKTTVVLQHDRIEVSNAKLTPTEWSATVKVRPDVAPTKVLAYLAAPVSFSSATVRAFDIRCPYEWKVQIAGGDMLVLKTAAGPFDAPVEATVMRKGAKASSVKYDASTEDGLRLTRQASPEEVQARSEGTMAMLESKEMKALDARSQKAIEEIGVCSKKSSKDMQACMAGPSSEMKKIGEERQALMKKAQTAVPSSACDEISVTAKDEKLTGKAHGCPGKQEGESVEVTGTYRAL